MYQQALQQQAAMHATSTNQQVSLTAAAAGSATMILSAGCAVAPLWLMPLPVVAFNKQTCLQTNMPENEARCHPVHECT
jgi:hypothetical protein